MRQETNALEFACRYSLITNRLDYCGKSNAFLAFQDFIENPSEKKIPEIKGLLDSFYGEKSYVELIAALAGKNRFDSEVLEAYWIGNELLEKVPHNEIQNTILSLQKFGLPKKIALEKASALPFSMLPHHSLHVLHVNFITPKLKPLLQNLSNCLIQWAEVKKLNEEKGKIEVKGIELKNLNNKFVLEAKIKSIENPFSLLPEKKSFVSVHWNNAIQVLSETQLKNLKKFTLQNLEAVNSIR